MNRGWDEGGIPSKVYSTLGVSIAKLNSDIVAELMTDEQCPVAGNPTCKQVLIEAFGRLRKTVCAKKPSKKIETIIAELETILRLDS